MSAEATPASLARALTAVSPNPPVENRPRDVSRIRLRVSSQTAPCGRPGRRFRAAVRGRLVTTRPPCLLGGGGEYRKSGSKAEGGGISQQCGPSLLQHTKRSGRSGQVRTSLAQSRQKPSYRMAFTKDSGQESDSRRSRSPPTKNFRSVLGPHSLESEALVICRLCRSDVMRAATRF